MEVEEEPSFFEKNKILLAAAAVIIAGGAAFGIVRHRKKKKAEEANQRAEKVNNEIDSILDETKESIIKYIKMQFHEDISDFISTFSKQQIRNLQKHLYDFEEFEELKNYLQKSKGWRCGQFLGLIN